MSRRQHILLAAGLSLLALTWTLPLETLSGGRFPAHMLRHMMLVAIVPPVLVLGLPARALRAAPPLLLGAAVEAVLVWGWHLPALHAAARLHAAIAVIEQLSFLAAGLMVWAGALRTENPLAGAGGLLLTSMHMTLLGALFILAPRDLCAPAIGIAPDLAGQQIGGMLMLAIGTPAYIAGGLWLASRALTSEETPA